MVRFFQSAYLTRYLVIFFLAAIYWIPTFIVKTTFVGESLPVFNAFLWLLGNNFYVSTILAFLITLSSALALNQLCSEFGISDKVSTLGGFLFILLASSSSFFTTMLPFIPATFLLLLLLRNLFSIPHANNPIPLAYNSGFLVGFAALFYTQIALLIMVVWIALYIHRAESWRSYVVSTIGLASPFLFAFVWYFWTDQLNDFISLWVNLFKVGNLNSFIEMSYLNMAGAIIIFFFVLYAMLNVLAGLREKSINLRRNLMISFYFFVIVVLMVLLSGQPEGMYLFVLPSSILLVQTLNKPPRERLVNMVLILLVFLLLATQYSKLASLL
jgi:hypothetical protein